MRVPLTIILPVTLLACASESEIAYQDALDCHKATLSFNQMGDDNRLRAADPSKFSDSADTTAMWKSKVEAVGKDVGKSAEEIEDDIGRNFGDLMASARSMSPDEVAAATETEFAKAVKCAEKL